MFIIEILNQDGSLTTEKFNKQIEIIRKYGLAERSVRNSCRNGNFIKGKEITYKVSELDDNEVGDILNNMPLSEQLEHLSPSYEKVEDYTIGKDKDIYKAVILADYHFPYQDKGCSEAFMKFINDNKDDISEIVDAGDGADCGALSTHLHLEEEKMELYKELEGYAKFTKNLKEVVKCKMTVLSDNHFVMRLKRYIAQNPAMKNMIREVDFGYDEKIAHGIPYFPLNEYGQNKIAGIHGINCSDNFTKGLTMDYNHDMFQAHTHTIQVYHNKNSKTAFGLPCMCKLEMAYMMGRAHRWRQGWTVLSWFPKENRYTMEIVEYKDGKAFYRDKVYKNEQV